MDIEKTIEFLLSNQAKFDANQAAANERLTRLENVVGMLADNVSRLDDVMETLAESHIKLIARLDTIAAQSEDRDRQLGERINSLVSAVGVIATRLPPPQPAA